MRSWGIPLVQAYYIPFTPTRAYPAFVVPKPPSFLGTLPNRPSYQVARQMIWQAFRSADKRARRELTGSAGGPRSSARLTRPAYRGQPILYGHQPGRHPAARGLGCGRPRDRLLVPRSGRGLDAGPRP